MERKKHYLLALYFIPIWVFQRLDWINPSGGANGNKLQSWCGFSGRLDGLSSSRGPTFRNVSIPVRVFWPSRQGVKIRP